MPRKKRKSNRKGKSWVGGFLKGAARFILRMIPVALVFGMGFGIFTGVRDALYADTSLLIQKIVVTPADALTVGQRERLEVNWLGKHLFDVDLKKIAKTLQKDPSVKKALVLKRPPSGLEVQVDRRIPFGYIRFSKTGTWALVSEDGVIMDVLSKKAPTGILIEAHGLGSRKPSLGYEVGKTSFVKAVAFYRAFENTAFSKSERISKLKLDRLGNVSAILGQGPELRLGRNPMNALEHFHKLGSLLENGSRAKIDYIDLQFDDIIVRRK